MAMGNRPSEMTETTENTENSRDSSQVEVKAVQEGEDLDAAADFDAEMGTEVSERTEAEKKEQESENLDASVDFDAETGTEVPEKTEAKEQINENPDAAADFDAEMNAETCETAEEKKQEKTSDANDDADESGINAGNPEIREKNEQVEEERSQELEQKEEKREQEKGAHQEQTDELRVQRSAVRRRAWNLEMRRKEVKEQEPDSSDNAEALKSEKEEINREQNQIEQEENHLDQQQKQLDSEDELRRAEAARENEEEKNPEDNADPDIHGEINIERKTEAEKDGETNAESVEETDEESEAEKDGESSVEQTEETGEESGAEEDGETNAESVEETGEESEAEEDGESSVEQTEETGEESETEEDGETNAESVKETGEESGTEEDGESSAEQTEETGEESETEEVSESGTERNSESGEEAELQNDCESDTERIGTDAEKTETESDAKENTDQRESGEVHKEKAERVHLNEHTTDRTKETAEEKRDNDDLNRSDKLENSPEYEDLSDAEQINDEEWAEEEMDSETGSEEGDDTQDMLDPLTNEIDADSEQNEEQEEMEPSPEQPPVPPPMGLRARRRAERERSADAEADRQETKHDAAAPTHGGTAVRMTAFESSPAPVIDAVELGDTVVAEHVEKNGDLPQEEQGDKPEREEDAHDADQSGSDDENQNADPNAGSNAADMNVHDNIGLPVPIGAQNNLPAVSPNNPPDNSNTNPVPHENYPDLTDNLNTDPFGVQAFASPFIRPRDVSLHVDIPDMTTNHQTDCDPYLNPDDGKKGKLYRAFHTYDYVSNVTQANATLADRINKMRADHEKPVTFEEIDAFCRKYKLEWKEKQDFKTIELYGLERVPKDDRIYRMIEKIHNGESGEENLELEELARIQEEGDAALTASEFAEAFGLSEAEERCLYRALEFKDGHPETIAYERQKELTELEFGPMQFKLSEYTGHGVEHVKEVLQETVVMLDAYKQRGVEITPEVFEMAMMSARYHDIGMADQAMIEKQRTLLSEYRDVRAERQEIEAMMDGNKPLNSERIAQGREKLTAYMQSHPECIKVDMVKAQKAEDMQADLMKQREEALERMRTCSDDALVVEMAALEDGMANQQSELSTDIRKNHGRRSAEYILAHSGEETMKAQIGSIDPRNMACAVLLHTKTNSGCPDLMLEKSREKALTMKDACQRFVREWNAEHPDKPVRETFTQEDLDQILITASVLRPADNRREGTTTTFTDGRGAKVVRDEKETKMGYRVVKDGGSTAGIAEISAKIIGAEISVSQQEVRMDAGGMRQIHAFEARNLDNEAIRRNIMMDRFKGYVDELESGALRSEEGGVVNVLEIRVNLRERECAKLQEEWRKEIASIPVAGELDKYRNLRPYAQNNRVIVVPVKGGNAS